MQMQENIPEKFVQIIKIQETIESHVAGENNIIMIASL